MKYTMNELLETQRNVHVLYAYSGAENYLQKLLNYIEEGVAAGDHVLIVENERVTKKLGALLAKTYNETQRSQVHFVNSLQFYWSTGSYHPPAIHQYFTKTVEPFIKSNQAFRSWAHVEWESVKEPLFLIEDFEKMADRAVNEYAFPLICAYEKQRMPHHLTESLMRTHPYVLLEDDLVASNQYQSS